APPRRAGPPPPHAASDERPAAPGPTADLQLHGTKAATVPATHRPRAPARRIQALRSITCGSLRLPRTAGYVAVHPVGDHHALPRRTAGPRAWGRGLGLSRKGMSAVAAMRQG